MVLMIKTQMVPLKEDTDGVMRVGGTRVTLDTVVHAYEQGHTVEEIVSRYPALGLADVYAVIAYYLNHRAEVTDYLQRQADETDKIWTQIEARHDYRVFRERLASRYEASSNSSD